MLIKVFFTSVLFSSFIYFEYFNLTNIIVNTIFGLLSLYLLLTIDKKALFYSGFTISILWFWWLGYSFVHYELSFLIPLILIGVGLIYGLLFYLTGMIENIFFRALGLFILSFVYPFGFNWLQLELPFVNSLLGTSKIDFALILLSIILIVKLENYKRYIAIVPLLFALNIQSYTIQPPQLKIHLASLDILQEHKWDKIYLEEIINKNFEEIDKAIENKNDLVVLPETAFPLLLNKNQKLIQKLKEKSTKISIITGSLYKKDGLYYNSTYFFEDTKMEVAHKVVLIPFGEAVPFPKLIKDIINNNFYDGASDYEASIEATDFTIKGIKFRNAICYEATTNKIFENLKGKYMIAISNNAWFVPSTQPTLQNLLLKYYALKHNVKIFSCANMSANKVIN